MKNLNGPPDSVGTLIYDPRLNRFKDDGDIVIHNLHQWFAAWQLDVWKKTKEYALLKDKHGELWEVVYNSHESHPNCNHHCLDCPNRCEIYKLVKD